MRFTSNWCDKGLCMVAVAALALGWATTAAADDVPATGQVTCYKLERYLAPHAAEGAILVLDGAGQPEFLDALVDDGTGTLVPMPNPAFDSTTAVVQDNPTACAGTGQDGEHLKGAKLRYVDKGDGRIKDKNTLLEWEKKSDDCVDALTGQPATCGLPVVDPLNPGDPAPFVGLQDKDNTYTWEEAFAYVQFLNNICEERGPANQIYPCATDSDCAAAGVGGECGFAGKRDWRLPNVRELSSIVKFEVFSNSTTANPTVDHEYFHKNCVPGVTVFQGSCTHADDVIHNPDDANPDLPADGDLVPFNTLNADGSRKGLRVPMTYWSSTSGDAPGDAWFVDYFTGDSGAHRKDLDLDVDACPQLVGVPLPDGLELPEGTVLAKCDRPEAIFAGHVRAVRRGKR